MHSEIKRICLLLATAQQELARLTGLSGEQLSGLMKDEGWTDFVEWVYERDKEIGFD